MCQVFISADPHLYDCRVRSVRLHGVATSIRLENLFWNVLADIAARDGMRVPQLCTKLYDELVQERGEVDNFASFLRVCCGRYLALQLSGGIPQDSSIPISSLNAQRVLATERNPASPTTGFVPYAMVPASQQVHSRVA
jgi:predicted DNA-binding ribbon-helix-helix protein